MAVEQVLIEFVSDTTQLEPAVDQLERLGKIEKTQADQFKATNAEMQKQVKTLDSLAGTAQKINQGTQPLRKTIVDINNAAKGMGASFLKEFREGAAQALHDAGVSAQELEEALEKASTSGNSLKAQLRQMTEELARMKVEGRDNTEEYRKLALQAGQLKDDIGDANQEIKNFGSDTSTLDGVISLAGGVAGGFAAIQGAAALFGDESEELQKTLLRVNAAMAILQGLQQLQIVLQKESAAASLADVIAKKAQTAAQIAYNFVVGASTGLLKVFRIALAATGIGLFVILVYELVTALKSQNNELEDANFLIDAQNKKLETANEILQRRLDIEVARARAAGAAESEITRITGRNLQAQREALVLSNKVLAAQRAAVDTTSEAWFKLNEQIEANNDAIRVLDTKTVVESINLEKQLADERAEALKKRQEAAKKEAEEARQRAKEQREADFNDFKAGVELQLLAAAEGSEEQLALRKKLSLATLQIDLDNEKLTLNERKLLIQKFFADRIELEKKFKADRERIILEDITSDINAELQTLELTNERRLELTETAINLAAELEINAANGNAAKIAEINAKRDKSIRDARLASIKEVLDYELQSSEVANAATKRALTRRLSDEKTTLVDRIRIIDELTTIESGGIQKRIDALNKEREEKLITQREYNLEYDKLVDEQAKVWEDAEAAKTAATKKESERRREQTIEDINLIVETAQQVVDVLDALSQLQSDKENNRIAQQKQQLKDLQDAGAITEKEAQARAKRIEAEERKARQDQARREKAVAVFNSLLAIPQAYLTGLKQGGPILAAIYGGLATVQALIVASRPIPKFGKGKKDSYQGLAQVGETGPELIEHNGKMYVADKPQIVYLGKKDKVFNPTETMSMLSKSKMNTERVIIPAAKNNGYSIDYKKMGKEIGKHLKTDVYVDGVHAQHIEKQLFLKYLDGRRGLP